MSGKRKLLPGQLKIQDAFRKKHAAKSTAEGTGTPEKMTMTQKELEPRPSTSTEIDKQPRTPTGSCLTPSTGITGSTAKDAGKIQHVKPLQDILGDKEKWIHTSKAHGQSASALKRQGRNYDFGWKKLYPWAIPIRDDESDNVIGLVCSQCREECEHLTPVELKERFHLSDEKWINLPFTNFGRFTEQAWLHEFGKKHKPSDWSSTSKGGPIGLRKSFEAGKIAGAHTAHMEFHLAQLERERREAAKNEVSSLLATQVSNDQILNRETIKSIMLIVYHCLKKKLPLYTNARELVQMSQDLNSPQLERIKHLSTRQKYCSNVALESFVEALYYSVILGIYLEMSGGENEDYEPLFSVMPDAGSTSKIREFIAVCIKYTSYSGTSTERAIAVLKTNSKDGETIANLILQAIEDFNQIVSKLQKVLPLNKTAILKTSNIVGYGSDGGGGARSKYISANCRLKEHNARQIDIHCVTHRSQLSISTASTGSEFLRSNFDISVKLHELFTSSPRVAAVLYQAQIVTGETANFKRNQPRALTSRPMHRWESEFDHLLTLEAIPLSVESALSELKTQANDPNAKKYQAHFLYKMCCKTDWIMYIAMKLDILEVVVPLIKKTESPELDLSYYLISVENTKTRLTLLKSTEGQGKHYKVAKARLSAEGDLKDYVVGDLDILKYDGIKDDMCDMFVEELEERHSDRTVGILKGMEFFSMTKFKIYVTKPEMIYDYGQAEIDILVEYFCSQIEYTAKWPEMFGKVIQAEPVGSEEELRAQLTEYKEYVHHYFMGVNPATKKGYTTTEVLASVLGSGVTFCGNGTVLNYVIRTYLSLPLSTADVERAMSVLKYIDTPLTRAATTKSISRRIVIKKEGPSTHEFDTDLAVSIWQRLRPRRLPICSGSEKVNLGKKIVLGAEERTRLRLRQKRRYIGKKKGNSATSVETQQAESALRSSSSESDSHEFSEADDVDSDEL